MAVRSGYLKANKAMKQGKGQIILNIKESQMTTVFSNPEGIAEVLSWKNTNN